jgi:alpha-ketoglutaric semialdehyde dehydrogenase
VSRATTVWPNLIGGEWLDHGGDGRLDVTDPADLDTVIGAVPALDTADVAAGYAQAAAGFAPWRDAGPLERARVLAGAARLLRERSERIAVDLVHEMGKTLAEATVETAKAADFLDYYASLARLPVGQLLADGRPGVEVAVRTEPVGVVLAITPWNDPLLTPARKLAPALFAGNAVVLKPASETPLVALHLARALHDAGLPPGVLGTVTGRSSRIADALLHDERVAAVTFTGSTAVGTALRRALSDSGVRLQTEMGGKNASVVLADVDLEGAAATVAAAAFGQGGQRCTATSRVIVDRRVAAQFAELLVARARATRLGPGMASDTDMGPLVSAAHRAEVLDHVERARAEGAHVLIGATAPDDPALSRGCYVLPTVLHGVRPDMAIWREETFGPVVALSEASDLDEAIAAANDSAYGLSAAVFTRSLADATRFAAEVEAGQVAINLPTSGWDVHQPFGGFRQSGSAFKEQGLEGLRFYTRVKTIATRAFL